MARGWVRTGIRLGFAIAGLMLAGPTLAEPMRPAELPPADYAGQQYVDSKGCLFMRAGKPGREMWLPRVTREGVPLCGNPPSGHRVPVVEDGAAAPVPADEASGQDAPAPAVPSVVQGTLVAVGSFAETANAAATLAWLRALNYPAVQGRLAEGTSSLVTVFAGPFATRAEAEQALRELRSAGYSDAVLLGP